MGLLSFLEGPAARMERRTSLQNGDPWLVELLSRGTQTSSGTWVTPDTALRIAAVYRAVQVIASGIAMTELCIYRELAANAGKKRAPDNPLYSLLHDSPNPWQTAFEFREQQTANAVLNGNGYAEIIWRGDGTIRQLNPLNPERVRPYMASDGNVWYEFRPIQGKVRQIASDEMFHLKGFSRDGITGLSPIALMRETVGLAQAAEEYQARFFSNDATPPLVITTPQVLSAEAQKRLQQSWSEGGAGLPNAHRPRVLEQGVDLKVVGISNHDAEFLALRKFQISDIARMFGVPPHMLQDLDRATFNNIEQLSLEFVTFCLAPWMVRWQQAISTRLMSAKMRANYFAEFRPEKLVVSDVLARYQAWNAAIISGWVNRNEVREREGFNPVTDPPEKGLDVFVEPMNVQPVGAPAPKPMSGKIPGPVPSPAEDDEEDDEEKNAMRAAIRELVVQRTNRIVRKETTALRRIAKKHAGRALETEIEKFYSEFEGGGDHIKESRRALRQVFTQPDVAVSIETLLSQWDAQRAKQIVEKEMERWETK